MQVVDSEGYLKVKLVGGPVGPFVPYTGATANVDLGEYEIKAGQFTLDTSPTGTAVVGTTRWNNTIGSSETTLKGGSVILKNGVDLVARVVNKVTPNATLTKANYTAVRVSGAQGQRLAVAYAQADSDANSADTIGLVTETIATNQEGFIMTVGQLEGINTTGSLQGETWVDGNVLYLSPTIPGALTNIKPNGLTGHIVVMGYVEYAHAINGKIYVKIMNGWELDELHNVYINPATIANNNILQYDSADQLWKNQVLNTGITIGTTAITSGTVGRVLFEGTGNVVQESANLFWDNTNGRLGIGTSSPAFRLEVQGGDVRFANGLTIGTAGSTGWQFSSNTLTIIQNGFLGVDVANGREFSITNTAFSTTYFKIAATTGNVLINTTTDAGFKLDVNGTARVSQDLTLVAGNAIRFGTSLGMSKTLNQMLIYGGTGAGNAGGTDVHYWNGSAFVVGLRLNNNANVLINTTTDAGFRLDVNGTARVQGNLTLRNVTDELLFANATVKVRRVSDKLSLEGFAGFDFIDTNTAFTRMQIRSTGNVLINTTTDAGFRLDVNGTARVTDLTIGTPSVDNNIRFGGNNTRIFNSIADNSLNYQSVFSASTVFRFTTNSSLPNANTSGTNVFMSLPIGFAPTSGTGTWSQLSLTPTINQTGGASGITRGLYVNPTLTAAADFRAIETTAGRVIFGGLPTSSAGLPTGAIWNDAGTLKIV